MLMLGFPENTQDYRVGSVLQNRGRICTRIGYSTGHLYVLAGIHDRMEFSSVLRVQALQILWRLLKCNCAN
jgi:hypothetical protein